MRTVMGWVVVAVLVVGCDENGPSAPVEPECEAAVALCPEGLTAFCDGDGAGDLATFVIPSSEQCVADGHNGPALAPTCALASDAEPSCSTYTPACVEAPSTDADDCARWLAECDAMGETQCYVPAGTDDVTPL